MEETPNSKSKKRIRLDPNNENSPKSHFCFGSKFIYLFQNLATK